MDAAVTTLVEGDASLYQDQRPIWNIAGAKTRPPAPVAMDCTMQSESCQTSSATEASVVGHESHPAANGNPPVPVPRRQRRLSVVCGLAGILLATAAMWLVSPGRYKAVASQPVPAKSGQLFGPPHYTAVALLRIAANEQPLVFQTVDRASAAPFEMYKRTQQQMLASDVVLIASLRKPEAWKLTVVQKESDPARWLARNIRVDFPGDAEIMRVSLTSEKPEEAAVLLQAVVDAYMNEVVQVDRNKKNARLEMLDKHYDEKEAEIRKRKSEIKSISEQLGVGDSGAVALKQRVALEAYADARTGLAKLRAELQQAKDDLHVKQAVLTASQPKAQASTDAEAKNAKPSKLGLRIVELKARIEILSAHEQAAAKDLDDLRQKAERVGNSSIDVEMMRRDLQYLEKVLAAIAADYALSKGGAAEVA